VGRQHGITEQQLAALADHDRSAAFSELEHAVLRLADAMTATPVAVGDELIAALRRHFDEPQLLELTAAIAWENYRARLAHALAVPAEGYSAGAFCPLPARGTS
jgi:alkylhydroperoxidase family enzyme